MSVKSELRAEALDRAGHNCEWPSPWHEGRLEMAHLVQSSQGGADLLSNVVMLCKRCHDVLDSRVSWNQALPILLGLLDAYFRVAEFQANRHTVTPLATGISFTDGALPQTPTSKHSSTGFSTVGSLPRTTSTTETATQQTTGQRTYNPSLPKNTDAPTATSTTTKRGGSTRPAYPQSKSGNDSVAIQPLSVEDSESADGYFGTLEPVEDSTSTLKTSSPCLWPGSLHAGSVQSSVYPIPRFGASSGTPVFHSELLVDMCEHHADVLDNHGPVPKRRQAIMELLQAYTRNVATPYVD